MTAGLSSGARSKPNQAGGITRQGFVVILAWTLMIVTALCAIGQLVNVTAVTAAVYVAFLWVLYVADTRFLVEYFWVVIILSLSVAGVYVCEQGVYLGELEMMSSYQNALAPLVLVYVLFFGVIECYRLGKEGMPTRQEPSGNRDPEHARGVHMIALLGLAVAFYLLAQVASNPYFAAGVNRLAYAQDHMSPISVSMRSYLPLFIPIAAMSSKCGNRRIACAFYAVLLAFYFLEGDKFGAYLFAAYIFTLMYAAGLDERLLKKVVAVILAFFCLLLVVVYVQRVLLFNSDLASVSQYLNERLAQQGEVWWSVYSQASGSHLGIGEFGDELAVLFGGTDIERNHSFGQWKMMSVAAHYSSNSLYRILIGVPYTATTAASVFYYFRWPGMILFYALIAMIYAVVVSSAMKAFRDYRILESMIYVKLISVLGTVITSSNLTYICSPAGVVYIGALAFLTLNRSLAGSRPSDRHRWRELQAQRYMGARSSQ